MDLQTLARSLYPYAAEFGVVAKFPEHGLERQAILDQLRSQDWVPRLVRLKASL